MKDFLFSFFYSPTLEMEPKIGGRVYQVKTVCVLLVDMQQASRTVGRAAACSGVMTGLMLTHDPPLHLRTPRPTPPRIWVHSEGHVRSNYSWCLHAPGR